MNLFESGGKYSFFVKESSDGHKPFSIVEHDNETYYYPKFLFSNSDVELIIKKIDKVNNKIFFETEITQYVDDELISTKLVSINNNNPINGELTLNYKSHKILVKCPKWMSSENFSFPEDILLKVVGSRLKKILILYFAGDLDHFKFNKDSSYDLKFLKNIEISRYGYDGVLKKTNLLRVEDTRDKIIYDAKQNFASTNLIEGNLYSFRYLGLDRNYKPLFVQDNKSIFLKPEKILKKIHLDFINEEHLVNNKLRVDLFLQIKNTDNFWILSMSRYLTEVIQSYIQRVRYSEARLAVNIYNLVSGYIISKDFFSRIPKTIARSTKPYFEEDILKVKSAEDFLNFQEKFEFEKLFKKEISFTLKHQISILRTLFKLKIIDRENIGLLNQIYINLKNDRDNEDIVKVVDENIDDYFQDYIFPIKDEFSKKYFLKFNDRNEWLENNQVETIFSIAKFLKENSSTSINYFHYLNYILLESLIKFKNENQGLISFKTFIKDLQNFNSNFELKKHPTINKNVITIYNRPIEISTLNSYLIYDDKFILISSPHCYLINYMIEEFGFVNLKISSSIKDCIYNTILDLSSNQKIFDNSCPFFINKAIIKTLNNKGARHFATYGIDINSEDDILIYDSVLFDDKKYGLAKSTSSFRLGQVVNLKESVNSRLNELQKLKPDYDSKYNFINQNEKFEIIIWEKIYKKHKGSCSTCNEYEIDFKGNHSWCNNCNSIYIDCVKAYIPKLDKFVYFNEDCFENENLNFYDELKTGDRFLFLFLSEFTFRVKHESLTSKYNQPKIIDINFQKVKSINFYGNFHESSNEYSIYKYRKNILYSFFTIINDIISSNLNINDRHNLINLNILIGGLLRSPKSYLLRFLNNYDELIKSIDNNIDISEKVKMVREKIDDRFVQTSEIFPQIKQLFKSVEIVGQIENEEYSKQFQLLNSTKGFNNKLIKSVLINNLISSEDKNSKVLKHVRKNIVDLMQRERNEISFNIGNISTTKISQEVELLQDIKNRISTEGQNLEFKETLFVPVLNNSERKRIIHLEKEIERKPNKEEENRKIISEIKKEVKKQIGNKAMKEELAYSTIKNICAFLNSNDGILILGVRDDNTLVGIEEDIKLCGGDFDNFLQEFENYWKNFVQDSSYFRPYVEIKKVTYESLDFCFMKVKYPQDIKDPCFIKKGNKDDIEKCYLKESSTTNIISGRTLRNWKRKTTPQTNQPTYVYLMVDKYGIHKIGMAKNVEKRQGTLMSQDKGIEIVNSFIFPNRAIAGRLEKYLHLKYDKHRTETGGEWFNIDDNQIKEIETLLKSQMEIHPTEKKGINNLTLDL